MRRVLMASAFILMGLGQLSAQDQDAVAAISSRIRSSTPAHWDVRVRWRENAILASITPPYQEAFDLWYDPQLLIEKLEALCPKSGDRLWELLSPEQDVILEPTVGGKAGVEMRVSCRKVTFRS